MAVPRSPDSLDRFVRAVHRRQVALRVVECAGLGLLGATALASVLAGILLWRGDDAWRVAGPTLLIGPLVGALWGATTRPSVLAAAGEADRQLRTADLLATAWAVRGQPSEAPADAFRQTVLALAAARCERLSPSAVVLRRLGVRAWGGIGLAVAFVATLSAMSSEPLRAGPHRSTVATTIEADDTARRPIVQFSVDTLEPRQRRVEASPGDDRPLGAPVADESAENAATEQPPADMPRHLDRATANGASTTGSGMADASGDSTRDSPRPVRAANDASPTTKTGRATAGAGRPAAESVTDETQPGGVADAAATASTPWQSPAWRRAAESADTDVRAGRIPDAYRDLVRGYFDAGDRR